MSDNKEISIKSLFSFEHCLECIAALIAAAGLLGVLQTFVIGKHFLIPTIILSAVLLFGNLAWWGLQGQRWAKYFLFWGTFLLTMHGFLRSSGRKNIGKFSVVHSNPPLLCWW